MPEGGFDPLSEAVSSNEWLYNPCLDFLMNPIYLTENPDYLELDTLIVFSV